MSHLIKTPLSILIKDVILLCPTWLNVLELISSAIGHFDKGGHFCSTWLDVQIDI
jgi:hypothetical protein